MRPPVLKIPFKPPRWWEGHRIGFKVYPFGPGTDGRYSETLCERDGGRQRRCPMGDPGTVLRFRGGALEIDRVELAGEEIEERFARHTWIITLRHIDGSIQPRSMDQAYADMPSKAVAKMVTHAKRVRMAAWEGLKVKEGDILLPAAPDDRADFAVTVLQLPELDGGMFFGRRDLGGDDVRDGWHDIDRKSGSLYAGPCWKKIAQLLARSE